MGRGGRSATVGATHTVDATGSGRLACALLCQGIRRERLQGKRVDSAFSLLGKSPDCLGEHLNSSHTSTRALKWPSSPVPEQRTTLIRDPTTPVRKGA